MSGRAAVQSWRLTTLGFHSSMRHREAYALSISGSKPPPGVDFKKIKEIGFSPPRRSEEARKQLEALRNSGRTRGHSRWDSNSGEELA